MSTLPIVIAANFTAEPIRDVLSHWIRTLDLDAAMSFAPPDQVMQQVLDPASEISRNTEGVSVLLVRPYGCDRPASADGREDRSENRAEDDTEEHRIALAAVAIDDLVRAVDARMRASGGLWIVVCCPPPPTIRGADAADSPWDALERRCVDGLDATPGTCVIRGTEILRRHGLDRYHDEHGRRLADMPYTPAFYAALGTAVARAIHAMVTPPRKAIVLDCDNTLWSGICGEAGAHGVGIDAVRQHLQRFFIDQMQRGALLCLCSRNEEADVWRVFDERAEMALRRDHIVASRINWRSKSENIRVLAAELQIGLETFIFVDDDPVECADVQWRLPDVVTVQLPSDVDAIPAWLEQHWIFDRWGTTDEDRARTGQYLLRRERDRHRAEARTVEEFVRLLDVRVTVRPAAASQLARIAQLTYRTTQFNCTLRRRSEAELRRVSERDDWIILAVEGADRYGDYGLIGALVACDAGEALAVDIFLLSCRALGRHIEQRMLHEIEAIARTRGYEAVRIPFVPGIRNTVAREFLDGLDADWSRGRGEAALEYVRRLRESSVTAGAGE